MMGLMYEPREADERVFIGREVQGTLGGDSAFGIVDADGMYLNQHAVRITAVGLRRYGGDLVARLDCAHDADGRVALHPDDPAMVRIQELEAEVERLRDTPPTLADLIVGSVNDHVAKIKAERDEALEHVAELEAEVERLCVTPPPVAAPELTDEIMNELWSAFSDVDRPSDGIRAMIAAYEAMRQPATRADVEKLAMRLLSERWAFALPHVVHWAQITESDRDGWRRVARAALEYRG